MPCDMLLQWSADDIYRDDVVFKDPRNTLRGKKNYQRLFKVCGCWIRG